MIKDCEGLTVHSVNIIHGRGPIFYASLPSGPSAFENVKGDGTNGSGDKHRLVSTLWGDLAVVGSPIWKRCQSSDRAFLPIQVVRGILGRPHFFLGEYRGPAISFSEGGGKIWAALSVDESDIGIDVAGPNEFKREFQRDYPYHRVFHPEELQDALRLAGGDLESASALLWSVKEAAVKALGSAFNLVDPLQITVYSSEEGAAGEEGGYTFPVGLSGKALVRFPLAARGSIWVRSLPQGKLWLSIALWNPRPAGLE